MKKTRYFKTLTNVSNLNDDVQDIGSNNSQEIFTQFVTGNVVTVYTNSKSFKKSFKEANVNSIIAHSHDEPASEAEIYYPLLRGMVDTPTQGEQVLLCELGGKNYYLGPLNTVNNPTFNPDPMLKSGDESVGIFKRYNVNPLLKWTFSNKRFQKAGRLLDKLNLQETKKNLDTNRFGIGDMMFEGRYGNSIRLGERGRYPLITISNGQNDNNTEETLFDDCLIHISSYGSLYEHFETNFNPSSIGLFEEGTEIEFTDTKDAQILIRSNKLTLDARTSNISLFTKKSIVSYSENLNMTTSNKVNLKAMSGLDITHDSGETTESMVLGDTLTEWLKELVAILESANALVQGVPIPITDSTAAPLLPRIQTLKSKLDNPKFLSTLHKIEQG